MEQLIEQSGDHLRTRSRTPAPASASLLGLSDEEDDDEVNSQAAPAQPTTVVMPSQRVVDHPLPSLMSRPRPGTTTTSRSSASALPSQNEAESDKKFDAFIRLRVGQRETTWTDLLQVAQRQDEEELAQPRPSCSAQPGTSQAVFLPRPHHVGLQLTRGSDLAEANRAAVQDVVLPRVAVPDALLHQAAEANPRAAVPDQTDEARAVEHGRQAAAVAPAPQTPAATPQVQAVEHGRQAAAVALPPHTPAATPQVQDAPVVEARVQDAPVPSQLPPAVGTDVADVDGGDDVADIDGGHDDGGVEDDDGGAAPEGPRRRSRRKTSPEGGSFPTRFSPRKSRGMGHKYSDTYYY